MMKILGIGAAALAAAMMVSAAHAAGDSKTSYSGPDWWLSQMDTNKDGSISRDEFNAARTLRFKRLDANGDGTVTTAERRAAIDKWNKANPSDQVTITDDQLKDVALNSFNNNSTRIFDTLDTNKDGSVSQAELDAAQTTGSLDRTMEGNTSGGNTGGPTGSGAAGSVQ